MRKPGNGGSSRRSGKTYDALIIGAGASGLFCAATAGKRGRRVLVLDHAARPGVKIAVSGGGHCNFTNLSAGAENYWSRNRSFCKSALARFGPGDFIELADRHDIAWREKKDGQIFCRGSSARIVEMLLHECGSGKVEFLFDCRIESVDKSGLFRVKTNRGEFEAPSLVMATGGLAAPSLGASGFGHDLARRFGLAVVPPRPALVPLTLAPAERELCASLAGVSLKARIECGSFTVEGDLLFTHRGLSGPAILEVSSCWSPGDALSIDISPDRDFLDLLEESRKGGEGREIRTLLSRCVPRRVAAAWCERFIRSQHAGCCQQADLAAAAGAVHQWRIVPAGTEGFEKAEVTLGGVDTNELSSKTMESRKVAGLLFTGEVVDVTGQLGGFNLQWAWASGAAAGEAV